MGRNEVIIADINRHCKPNSILIIDAKGTLRRLNCPFKVIVIASVHQFRSNDVVDVVAVRLSSELLLLYVIRQTAYPYFLFQIKL